MKAKGVPEDVAKNRASRQVPIMETTATGSFADPQDEKDAQEKFESDLAKSVHRK